MPHSLKQFASEAEIHAECKEDHGPFTYERDDGGFAIHASGFYTEAELEYALRALREANKFFVPKDKWDTRLQFVKAWRAFKQDPTPAGVSAIQRLARALKEKP